MTDQTPSQDAAVTSEIPATRASDDCCKVCLINRKDPRIALVPLDISVSASHARRQCISVGTDVHSAGLTLP